MSWAAAYLANVRAAAYLANARANPYVANIRASSYLAVRILEATRTATISNEGSSLEWQ